MNSTPACPHEQDVLELATLGRWPSAADRTLRDHVASCGICGDLAHVASVLADWREQQPAAYAAVDAEFRRLMPEFAGLELKSGSAGTVELGARLRTNGHDFITAEDFSQGTLYQLAILVLAFSPRPPAVVCLEEADRGMHPRSLRELRDTLYRLSYPRDEGLERSPVQVITTTHSPYLLDQFRAGGTALLKAAE